jgi:hypothetical protein
VVLAAPTQVTFSTLGSVLTISGGISGPGGLTISGPGTLRLGANTGTTTLSGLAVNTGGSFDINNNTVEINYGSSADPVGSILTALQTGYNGGAWTGTGIVSSAVANTVLPVLSIGYADGNTDTGTAAAPNTVLVKMTLAGDAYLVGTVNFNDLDVIGRHLNTTGNDWSEGNFTYDPLGAVNFNDLDIIGLNLNTYLGALGSSGDVLGGTTLPLGESAAVQNTIVTPEPSAVALAAAGASCLLTRRRRNKTAPIG